MSKPTKLFVLGLALVFACGLLWAGGQTTAGPKKVTIGVSLPTQDVERWVRDKENLISEAARQGADIKIQIANNDAARQIAQVENLLTEGIDVLMLAPHDAESSATSVEHAKEAGVPVMSYCRLVLNADLDAHIAFDNERVGELQGQYLAEHVAKGNIIILKGAKEDFNSILFHRGAMKYIQPKIDSGDYKIVMDQFVPNWLPANALKIVEDALTANKNNIQGILSPNDSLAGAAIQALAAQDLDGKVVVTGGDAELAAAKRVVQGTQSMTAYRELIKMDTLAIEVAIRLAKGEDISDLVATTIDNGYKQVPAILPEPQMVTKDNIDKVLIESGYQSRKEVYGQ